MKVKLNAENAKNARNSMMMNMYSAMFDWLIRRVNQAVAAEGICDAQIGVLDIFGFEIFEHNGFEQLCINYANEMLQLHFNTYTFQRETELYKREGINFEMVRIVAFRPTATTTRPSLRPPSLLVSTYV
jgi:myosin-5